MIKVNKNKLNSSVGDSIINGDKLTDEDKWYCYDIIAYLQAIPRYFRGITTKAKNAPAGTTPDPNEVLRSSFDGGVYTNIKSLSNACEALLKQVLERPKSHLEFYAITPELAAEIFNIAKSQQMSNICYSFANWVIYAAQFIQRPNEPKVDFYDKIIRYTRINYTDNSYFVDDAVILADALIRDLINVGTNPFPAKYVQNEVDRIIQPRLQDDNNNDDSYIGYTPLDKYFDRDAIEYAYDIFNDTVNYLTTISESDYRDILLDITTNYLGTREDGEDLINDLQSVIDYDAESANETQDFPDIIVAIKDYMQKLMNSNYKQELRKLSTGDSAKTIAEQCAWLLGELSE